MRFFLYKLEWEKDAYSSAFPMEMIVCGDGSREKKRAEGLRERKREREKERDRKRD